MSKNVTLLLSILLRCILLCIILLLGIFVFQWTISPALAQGGLLGNPGFETGSLPPWVKWGYPRSTVMALNCCGHSGSWSAWVVPDGRYVELQQNVSVTPRRTYNLTAWAYTNGLNAQVAWWSNATNSTVCASTNSTSYVQQICELNVPDGTTAFNVHLGANSPQGSGQWTITDDWSLTLKSSSGSINQAFALLRTNPTDQRRGVRANVWTDQQPPQSGGNFEASPVGVCTRIPCEWNSGFVETGFVKGTIDGVNNQLQQYASWQNDGGTGYDINYHLGFLNDNTWYNFGVEYDSGQGKWFATRDYTRLNPTNPSIPTLNFAQGPSVVCGLEASVTASLGVQCDTMQYLSLGGVWTSFNYNNVQINGPYCVYKPYQYGAIGWGPCY